MSSAPLMPLAKLPMNFHVLGFLRIIGEIMEVTDFRLLCHGTNCTGTLNAVQDLQKALQATPVQRTGATYLTIERNASTDWLVWVRRSNGKGWDDYFCREGFVLCIHARSRGWFAEGDAAAALGVVQSVLSAPDVRVQAATF